MKEFHILQIMPTPDRFYVSCHDDENIFERPIGIALCEDSEGSRVVKFLVSSPDSWGCILLYDLDEDDMEIRCFHSWELEEVQGGKFRARSKTELLRRERELFNDSVKKQISDL